MSGDSLEKLRHEIIFYDGEVENAFRKHDQFLETYRRELELDPTAEFALERCRDRLILVERVFGNHEKARHDE